MSPYEQMLERLALLLDKVEQLTNIRMGDTQLLRLKDEIHNLIARIGLIEAEGRFSIEEGWLKQIEEWEEQVEKLTKGE